MWIYAIAHREPLTMHRIAHHHSLPIDVCCFGIIHYEIHFIFKSIYSLIFDKENWIYLFIFEFNFFLIAIFPQLNWWLATILNKNSENNFENYLTFKFSIQCNYFIFHFYGSKSKSMKKKWNKNCINDNGKRKREEKAITHLALFCAIFLHLLFTVHFQRETHW